ncbi:hypothetical protein [Pedobacter xixiisoli]|uniref:Uncharacterized protein n=1 Tax=Pedobacter xixiisoli TaxID=1476464 RepID=A0A286A7D6_9SPHI|nr:hypothetical protein [Pedobacter xixiisoli]SOD17795.1 hypothetical protein SAMN06297358_2691 [Pedobacter xixiisoli]
MTKTRSVSVQEIYTDFMYELLQEKLYQSGGELKKALVDKFNISEDNARQIISRAASTYAIKSSKPYTFGHGQFIYLLPDKDIDINQVRRICYSERPPIYRLLTHMIKHGGIVSFYDAMKITASPDEESSTKVSTLSDIVKVLVKLNLVYEERDENGINYILVKDELEEEDRRKLAKPLMTSYYNKMVVDSSLIPDVLRWLSHSNLISTISPIYRNKKTPSYGAKHNNLLWDAYSYSKTTGINAVRAVKALTSETQTLVVLDVVLSDEYSQLELDGFYNRVQININSVKLTGRKIMPIIIYKTCSQEVLNKTRALGFLSFDIASIFGTRIYDILSKLDEINELLLENEDVEKSVRKILRIIRQSGQEEALRDLKGVLFETLMYPVLKQMFPNASIERGKLWSIESESKKETYQYDYIFDASQPDEIVVVELRGYNSNVFVSLGDKDKKGSLKWFYEHKLPFVEQFYKDKISQGKKLRGLYITSASFWDDGRAYIAKLNKGVHKPLKTEIAYERHELLSMLRANDFKSEAKIIDSYYIGNSEIEDEE